MAWSSRSTSRSTTVLVAALTAAALLVTACGDGEAGRVSSDARPEAAAPGEPPGLPVGGDALPPVTVAEVPLTAELAAELEELCVGGEAVPLSSDSSCDRALFSCQGPDCSMTVVRWADGFWAVESDLLAEPACAADIRACGGALALAGVEGILGRDVVPPDPLELPTELATISPGEPLVDPPGDPSGDPPGDPAGDPFTEPVAPESAPSTGSDDRGSRVLEPASPAAS